MGAAGQTAAMGAAARRPIAPLSATPRPFQFLIEIVEYRVGEPARPQLIVINQTNK